VNERATVRCWDQDDAWGVVDCPSTPGGCWVGFTAIDVAGFRSLTGVAEVDLDWERAEQDGFSYRAVRVRIDGVPPAPPPPSDPSLHSAYRSELTITWDDRT
jgi:CspA family cold shock protein